MNTILTQKPGCTIDCFKFRIVRQGKYQTIRDEVLKYSLKLMKDKGACMVKDAMNLFKDKILDQHGCTVSDNDCESHRKILGKTISNQGIQVILSNKTVW